jgi:hypothetical protein
VRGVRSADEAIDRSATRSDTRNVLDMNAAAGVCALRLIPRRNRAGVQTHAVGTAPVA